MCYNNNNSDNDNNDNNMEGGKDENRKLNDLECIPDKKHNAVANRKRNINNNRITPLTRVDVLAHNNEEVIETISSSDSDINGNNNNGDVDGYDSNNESLSVHGADLQLDRNYTFTNTNTADTETRSKK